MQAVQNILILTTNLLLLIVILRMRKHTEPIGRFLPLSRRSGKDSTELLPVRSAGDAIMAHREQEKREQEAIDSDERLSGAIRYDLS